MEVLDRFKKFAITSLLVIPFLLGSPDFVLADPNLPATRLAAEVFPSISGVCKNEEAFKLVISTHMEDGFQVASMLFNRMLSIKECIMLPIPVTLVRFVERYTFTEEMGGNFVKNYPKGVELWEATDTDTSEAHGFVLIPSVIPPKANETNGVKRLHPDWIPGRDASLNTKRIT